MSQRLERGISKQTLTHFQPMFHLNKPGCCFLLAKCLKKHLWKSDVFSGLQSFLTADALSLLVLLFT